MEHLKEILYQHAPQAHWYLFVAILLAGFNIPISADVLIVSAALLAAFIVPEHTWLLFTWLLVGCYLSALCSYWVGRLLGERLGKTRWFNKLMPPRRLASIQNYFNRYGLWTILIGRFIPFGIRNCVFMSSGMSKLSFKKFMLIDALACPLWFSLSFFLFFALAQQIDLVWHYVKAFNLVIFSAFSVTVITWVWYKHRKKAKTPT